MSKQNRFHTRKAGNEGTRVALFDPVTGEDTGDWLHILSMDSDAFQIANTKAMRELAQAYSAKGDQEERLERVKEGSLEVIASLVSDWSFEEPCTPENVKSFLRECPQIRTTIDKMAGERSLFIKSSSQPSGDGQSTTSDSAPAPLEAPQP